MKKINLRTVAFVFSAFLAGLILPFSTVCATPTQSEVETAKAKLNDLYEKAAQANEQLNATNVLIDQTGQKINDLNAQITSEQAEIDTKSAELAKSREQLATVVNADYKKSNNSLLSIILNASSFDDLISRIYYMNKMSAEQADTINQTQQLQNEILHRMDELSNAKANLVTQQTQEQQLASQQKSQKSSLDSQVSETQKYLNTLSAEVREEATKQDTTPSPSPAPTPAPSPSGDEVVSCLVASSHQLFE